MFNRLGLASIVITAIERLKQIPNRELKETTVYTSETLNNLKKKLYSKDKKITNTKDKDPNLTGNC